VELLSETIVIKPNIDPVMGPGRRSTQKKFKKTFEILIFYMSTGFCQFLHWPVFCLTRTGPTINLTRRAGPGLITMFETLQDRFIKLLVK
jgi:hypothetical protein